LLLLAFPLAFFLDLRSLLLTLLLAVFAASLTSVAASGTATITVSFVVTPVSLLAHGFLHSVGLCVVNC
jgi:hypothetical protein